jgi:hypothetical protein
VPAGAGTGGHRAGQIWLRRLPNLPLLVILVPFDGFRDGVRPGPARWLTGPQSLTVASIVSRRPGRCSGLACGAGVLWLWSSRAGTCADQVDSAWQAFLRRFDIEHTFRFLK